MFNGNNTPKSATILQNFGSSSIFVFILFPIAGFWNSPKYNVIQQIKKHVDLNLFVHPVTNPQIY